MNNLVQIREKLKKQERLHQAKLLATKNGELKSYSRSVYEKRLKSIQSEIDKQS